MNKFIHVVGEVFTVFADWQMVYLFLGGIAVGVYFLTRKIKEE